MNGSILSSYLTADPTLTLSGQPNDIGIDPNSLSFTTGPGIDNLSAITQIQPGALNNMQLSSLTANSIRGGQISGVTLKIGNNFSVDSSGNMTAAGGTIGGWTITSTTITSPNGNIVLDGANNRIILYNSGVPQVLIQG